MPDLSSHEPDFYSMWMHVTLDFLKTQNSTPWTKTLSESGYYLSFQPQSLPFVKESQSQTLVTVVKIDFIKKTITVGGKET